MLTEEDDAIAEEGEPLSCCLEPKVAVGVGKHHSGIQALRWALDKMIPAGGTVYLLHVQPPLRFIQTPLGNLPFDQANEESRKQARRQHAAAAEKLIQKYRKICEKKEVEPQVFCIESDSVKDGVLEQVQTLSISKLVLGSSSQSGLRKFFRQSQTSASIAQDAPDFCAVMVVHKGRLSSVKDAKHSLQSVSSNSSDIGSSKFDASFSEINKETYNDCRSSMRSVSSTFYNQSISSTSDSGFDYSRCSQFRVNNEEFYNTDNMYGEIECVKAPSINRMQLPPKYPAAVSDRGSEGNRSSKDSPVTKIRADDYGSSCSSENDVFDSQWDHRTSFRQDHCSNEDNITSSFGSRERSNSEACCQAPFLGSHQSCDAFTERDLKMEVNTLKAAISDKENVHNISREHAWVLETALKDLADIRLQTAAEIKRQQELLLSLERALKAALKEKEVAVQTAADEARKRKEVVTALAKIKAEGEAYRWEANSAKEQEAAIKSRYEEALVNLEKMKFELAREFNLRKLAEEKAMQEAVAKQKVIRLLQKAQCVFTKYSFEELQEATNNFSQEQKLGEGGYGQVYKGMLHHMDVAVKVLRQEGSHGQRQFFREVELLSQVHHPYIVALVGVCQERASIVYEYMSNGSLEDRLMCKGGTPPLPWYVRFSIIFETATALAFLHNMTPDPIIHRDLKPGNILLDHNFVSKLGDVGLAKWIPNNLPHYVTVDRDTSPAGTFAYMDPEYLRTGSVGPFSDVFALGIVILQILTGKRAVGVADMVEAAIDDKRFEEILDKSAGEWPLPETLELANLAVKCAEPRRRDRPNLEAEVLVTLQRLCRVAHSASIAEASFSGNRVMPNCFLCPLSQTVMLEPYIAADGFTYEHAAIKDWLNKHVISPMTNLKLEHTGLTRDPFLRTSIMRWKGESQQHCVSWSDPL